MKKARRKNEHFATSSFIQTFRMEFLYSILTLHEIQSYHFLIHRNISLMAVYDGLCNRQTNSKTS